MIKKWKITLNHEAIQTQMQRMLFQQPMQIIERKSCAIFCIWIDNQIGVQVEEYFKKSKQIAFSEFCNIWVLLKKEKPKKQRRYEQEHPIMFVQNPVFVLLSSLWVILVRLVIYDKPHSQSVYLLLMLVPMFVLFVVLLFRFWRRMHELMSNFN